jgi:DNA-directed RNA polymerase specialized sigma24 family protein
MVYTTERDDDALVMLLVRASKGSERAFGSLYDRLAAETYGICRATLDEEHAAQAMQLAWLHVWQHAASLAAAGDDPRVTIASVTWLVSARLARSPEFDDGE